MGSRGHAFRVYCLCVWAAFLVSSCGMREDELRCEQAVAHLVDCCPPTTALGGQVTPGFNHGAVRCENFASDGKTAARQPDISIEASRCLTGLDCATVLKNDLCNRVQQATNTAQPVTCP